MNIETFLDHIKKMDWVLIAIAVLLTLVGLVSIYSSSFLNQDFFNFKKQILFLVLGFFLMLVVSFFDWTALKENPYLILTCYFLSVLSLAALFFLAPLTKGTKGWYKLGPIAIDPIEAMKIILILLLAKYFSMRHIEMYNVKHILVSGIYVFLPCYLIFLQPDLGSVLILLLLWIGILAISGIKIKHFFLLSLAAVLIFSFAWGRFLEDYQKARIISFIVPHIEPLGIGWTSMQSKIAIGSGQVWGKGFRAGSQTQLGFLTAPQTDFIFAVIAEEFGFFGILVLFALLSILFLRIVRSAIFSRTNFSRLFVMGFAVLFAFQTLIHIGMNLGVLPVIGISLPFVSYGGSGLISNFIGLGILQSLKMRQE